MRTILGTALTVSIGLAIGIAVATAPPLLAQIVAPGPDTPTFEVASVKPNNNVSVRGGRGMPGRVSLIGMPVQQLIRQAYGIHSSQIIGGPDWLNSQGYDIDATTGDKPPDQNPLMMRTLLRDRFKLTFHTEKRQLDAYALVVARSDGRLGPGLRRTPEGECPPPGSRRGGGPQGPPDPNAAAPCGLMFAPGNLRGHGVEISFLAQALGNLPAITSFNRMVTNQTKLDGLYDFDFKFAMDFGRGAFPPSGGGAAPNPGDEPALFTALQEQLGLKLVPQRETLDVMVIDSVDRPTEN
jgi:uncharacterized protein (TIGR03435 family)